MRFSFSFVLLLNTLVAFNSVDSEEPFSVVVYNLENLFDVDGLSLYKDYKPEHYGIRELQNKLNAIVNVLQKIGGPSGPDILLLQEIEVDRSPDQHRSATDYLINALSEKGLGPYQVAIGFDPSETPENWPAVQCLTLSKFPIYKSRLLPLLNARPILETTLKIDGQKFTTFNNHWKSGASSQDMEKIRLQNASVLRKRLNELLALDPFHDFLVGGDFNSHYNQSVLYKHSMDKTGINHILLSSNLEHEKIIPVKNLYNLWHEIPPNQRGSDAWRGKWGTLMHMLLPVGLYDDHGIRYLSDSFRVAKFKGINMTQAGQLPFKWSNELNGFGASDHFPIFAFFRSRGPSAQKNNSYPLVEQTHRTVNFSNALKLAEPWSPKTLKPGNYGSIFRFTGKIENTNPLTIDLEGFQLGIFSFDPKIRKKLYSLSRGQNLSGTGHLSRYRGRWQFIVEEESWINWKID